MSSKEKYTVGYESSITRSLSFGIGVVVLCLVYMFVHALLANMEYKGYILIILLSLMGLYSFYLYFLMRPRVIVDGDYLEYFPRWDKKQEFCIDQISRREIQRGNDFSFFVEHKRTSSLVTMIYYRGEVELLRISTSLPNAARLDEKIVRYLQQLEG